MGYPQNIRLFVGGFSIYGTPMSISLVLYAHPPFKPDHVAEVSKIRNVLAFPLCFGSPSEDQAVRAVAFEQQLVMVGK